MVKATDFKRSKKWYGCIRDTRDPRDVEFKPKALRYSPTKDLRKDCPPVMDQGNLGSCTANGITGALRYLLIKNRKPDVKLSRLQLYYDERVVESSIMEDAGAEIRDGIKCAAKLGVGNENLWPYDIRRFTEKPPAEVYKDAVQFEALTYRRVAVMTSAVKTSISQGFPVVIGISLFESFESATVERTGVVPMPNINREQMIGGHCMYLVGYGQRRGYFTCRNSWHTNWGDKGDCYLPEQMVGSAAFGADYWRIEAVG